MESKIIPNRLACPTHPEEVVIRVNITPEASNRSGENNKNNAPKLFYCYECFEEAPENIKSKLIKFQDLLQTLQENFSSLSITDTNISLPVELKDIDKNRDRHQTEISDLISDQKQLLNQELKKIEHQIHALFQLIRKASNDKFDAQNNAFAKIMDLYSDKIESFTSTALEGLQDPETLQNRIFNSQRSTDPDQATAEVEKNLRECTKGDCVTEADP